MLASEAAVRRSAAARGSNRRGTLRAGREGSYSRSIFPYLVPHLPDAHPSAALVGHRASELAPWRAVAVLPRCRCSALGARANVVAAGAAPGGGGAAGRHGDRRPFQRGLSVARCGRGRCRGAGSYLGVVQRIWGLLSRCGVVRKGAAAKSNPKASTNGKRISE